MRMEKLKTCSQCGEEKELSEFKRDKRCKDGHASPCFACSRGIDVTDSEFFSAEASSLRSSKPVTQCKQDRQPTPETRDIPSPKIVDLDKAHPVLEGIKDKALRKRVSGFMGVLLEGGLHKRAMKENDFLWNQMANLFHKYEGLKDLYLMCKELGEEYRVMLRVDSAHERAVEGVEEPLYAASGKFLGYRTNYSDRLLELLLKADNPGKYRDLKEKTADGTVLNITMGFDRQALKEEQAKDIVEEPNA